MNLRKYRNHIILGLIFALALFLRLYNLPNVPVGFHEDEAQVGYNAYSILETGRDKNGSLFPLSVDQFGDFRPAGYHYLTIPSIAVFGLSELGVRFPAALIGALTVIFIFFLTKKLFENNNISVISSFIAAVIPWHVVASRSSSESIASMFFIVLGAVFLVSYFKDTNKLKHLVISGLLFFLSYFFYHSARFFLPMLVVCSTVVFIFLNKPSLRNKLTIIIFNLLIIFSAGAILLFSNGSSRPATVSIFSTLETQLVLDEQIREDGPNSSLSPRIFHNKLVNYSYTFIENYLGYFSGSYLFTKGGLPARYIVPNTGMLYILFAPLLLVGFAYLLLEMLTSKGNKRFSSIFVLLWLFLGPVPSALTWDDIPNIQRSIMMVPPLVLIISFGLYKIVSLVSGRRKDILIVILAILFSYNFLYFLHNYFSHSFTHRPWERSVGEKELVLELGKYVGGDRKIILTKAHANQPIFFLFYLNVSPKFYQENQFKKDTRGNIIYRNLTFVDSDCPLNESEKVINGAIYVNRGECPTPSNAKELEVIKRTDQTPAFKILEPR